MAQWIIERDDGQRQRAADSRSHSAATRYRIDFDALEAAVTPRTRLLLYTSPSNPLGWVATEDDQQGLLDFARRHGLWLMADEVYDRLYYAGSEVWAIRCRRSCAKPRATTP